MLLAREWYVSLFWGISASSCGHFWTHTCHVSERYSRYIEVSSIVRFLEKLHAREQFNGPSVKDKRQ